jgi:hypothetical protein
MSLKNFFESLDVKVQTLLVKVFGQSAVDNLEAEIKSIFEADVQVIFVDAINLAEALTVGGSPASGAQKQAAAFSQIVSDLKTKGISLAENVVNLGIELVVGLLKAKSL